MTSRAEQRRDAAIRDIGCIVCLLLGLGFVLCSKHHLLNTGHHGNGKRIGEKATVGLCDYHHQGKLVVGAALSRILYETRGPSYADNAREFRERWPDSLLLAEQNRRIEAYMGSVVQ